MNTFDLLVRLIMSAVIHAPLMIYLPLIASLGLIALKVITGERKLAKQGLKALSIMVSACLVLLGIGLVFSMAAAGSDPGGGRRFFALLFLGLSAASYVSMLPGMIYIVFFRRLKE